ncbi:MAG: hypothetical protein WCB48_00555, partial [Casimicrobiaceae bacterium]
MNPTDLTELMNLVLDAEATDDEADELERRLAADPAARARFEELQRLFDGLDSIPQAFPPEGLVASVMANIPQTPVPKGHSRQLLAQRGVIGPDTIQIGGAGPGRTAGSRSFFQPWAFFRGANMSEQNKGFSNKRKIMIGGAIAAAAAVVALSSLMQAPTDGKDTAGTIMPAQRYRATQSGAQDVQGGMPSGAPAGSNGLAGASSTGAQNAGAVNAGAQNAGAVNAGAQNAGAVNAGAQNAGAVNAGAQN